MSPIAKYKTFPIMCPFFLLGDPSAVRTIPTIEKTIIYLNINVKTEVLVNCNKTLFNSLNIWKIKSNVYFNPNMLIKIKNNIIKSNK